MIKKFKIFEAGKNKNYRINKHPKLKDIIPGMYIIITTKDYNFNKKHTENEDMYKYNLMLGKIRNIDEITVNSWGADIRGDFEYFIYVDIIDSLIGDFKNKLKEINLNTFLETQIYKNRSYKNTLKKFEELKTISPYNEWIIKDDLDKYNL